VHERASQEKQCAVTSARFILGDTRDVLKKLPDQSVDLVLSSPPFLALRSYLPNDHPDKAKEIGSEPTPAEFIDTLLDIVEICADKLTDFGSLCFELGDTYSGSGGAGGDYNPNGLRDGQAKFNGSSKAASSAYGGGNARVGTDRYEGALPAVGAMEPEVGMDGHSPNPFASFPSCSAPRSSTDSIRSPVARHHAGGHEMSFVGCDRIRPSAL
jgi:hypothetical protein